MQVIQNYEEMPAMGWEELCYGKAETLGDAGKETRWWQDNLL